jgi:predicted anti-sigma-YlaC factor YlaD
MDCDSAREAISAGIDGESSDLPDDVLETHLASCACCRAWQQRAHAVTRRARLGGAFLDHDLASRVLAAVPAAEPWWRRGTTRRAALLALALGQLAIAAPMLILGRDHDAGVHAAHELGSFNLALAVAFAVGAVRPKLSAGLAWPCGIAALGLAVTAIADLISGQALGLDEAMHLVAVAGAALLAWQARLPDVRSAGSAIVAGVAAEGPRPAADEATALERDDIPPQPPGGQAARLAAPDVALDIAAQATDRPADAASPARGGGGRDESVA